MLMIVLKGSEMEANLINAEAQIVAFSFAP
jgi:hypothetical protein